MRAFSRTPIELTDAAVLRSTNDRRLAGVAAAALMAAVAIAAVPRTAEATDLHYVIQAPSLGGNNPAAFQMAQYDRSLEVARVAAAAAAAKSGSPTDPNAAFVNAIISQLNGLVAQSIAQKIANSTDGQSGVLKSGSVSIIYMNLDGQLTITITSPSGSTTLTVPSGG